jgi:hypothetical protein
MVFASFQPPSAHKSGNGTSFNAVANLRRSARTICDVSFRQSVEQKRNSLDS